ncbi:unnamed protein product [Phytomonas sp. Hart1]|nr:unnamed protein product [Phytomonas sp. Hart1]|eukprot:CCW71141.1 unnamed protein product [Phytomonas sp. isolate Hart1]
MRLVSASFLAFAFFSFIIILGNNVDAAELPAKIYSQLGGEWNVEVVSPCTSFADGNVTFLNESASINWMNTKLKHLSTKIISAEEDADTLNLDGFNLFLVNGRQGVSYTICESQTNHLETTSRPYYEAGRTSTTLTQYSGVMDGNCDLANKRTFFIRTLGIPMEGKKVSVLKQKEVLQYVEVLMDIQELPNTCFVKIVEEAEENKSRSAKRRGLRAGAGELDSLDVFSKNGQVSIRFTKKSPSKLTFYEKYKASFMFVGAFLGFRIVNKIVQHKFSR